MKTIGVAPRGCEAQERATESAGTADPFDYQKLLDEWNGNSPLLRKLLETFSSESAADLAALEMAFGANNATQVMKLAHRIKGSAAVMGARRVREQAAMLEAYGQRRELNNAVACLRALQAELKQCHDFVASLSSGK